MSDNEPLEPLAPELARLFEREEIPAPSPGASRRVFGRLAASIAMAEAPEEPSVTAAPARPIDARSIGLALSTFVLGAAVGAGAALALRPASEGAHVEHPVAVADGGAEETGTAVRPAPPAPPLPVSSGDAPVATMSVPRPAAAPSSSADDTLAAERVVIDDARSRLAGGDAAGALERLDEHARRFPRARLIEEREALAIQALVNVGRHGEARERAERFRSRWPNSVYGPAVDTTLRSIP